jgi:hypothetical protein
VTSSSAHFPGRIAAGDIDLSFVPVRLPRLVSASVEGSAVLLDAVTGRAHLLDPTAAACWDRIDGRAHIGEIAAGLASAFGVDLETVQADVSQLIRSLGQQDMLENVIGSQAHHAHVEGAPTHKAAGHVAPDERRVRDIEIEGGPRFLEEPMTPCLEKLNRIDWVASSTFVIGGVHLGIRTNVPAVDAVLRRALAGHLVDGVVAPPNYSLLIDTEGRGYDFVYRSTAPVVRTRDPRRLAEGLVRHLSTHVQTPPSDLLHLKSTAFVSDGIAILAPAQARGWIEATGRRFAEAGLVPVDMPSAWVNDSIAELVVPEPAVEVDWEALAEFSAAFPHGRLRHPDPGVAPGRYPLVGWAFYAALEHVGTLDAATAALFGVPQVVDNREYPKQAVQRVGELVQKLETVGILWDKPAEMVGPLARLAERRPEPAAV